MGHISKYGKVGSPAQPLLGVQPAIEYTSGPWNLTATATKLASADATLQDGFAWRSSDNQNIPMTREDLLDFHGAMTDWRYNNYKVSWEHKAAINAIETIKEIEVYDIQKVWPDNSL